MVYLGLVLSTIIWGCNFIAARVLSDEVPPYTAGFIRFFCASVILIPLSFIRYRLTGGFRSRLWVGVMAMGLMGVLCYNVCFFQGMKFVEAGRASIIVSTSTIVLAILSAVFFNEAISLLRLFGIVLALTGVIIVITDGSISAVFSEAFSTGDLYILGAVVGFVSYVMICKAVMKELPMLQAITWSCVFGTCFLMPLAYSEHSWADFATYSPGSWISLLYLGALGTVASYLLYYNGVNRIGVTRAVVFSNFGPVVAVFAGWAFLGEHLSVFIVAGAVMVIVGVFLVNSKDREKFKPKEKQIA